MVVPGTAEHICLAVLRGEQRELRLHGQLSIPYDHPRFMLAKTSDGNTPNGIKLEITIV